MSEPTSPPLKNPPLAAFLAWLIPGLGHFYQGRVGKGLLYATCILGLYFTGFILGEGKVVYWRWINPLHDSENFRFSYLCQFFVGLPALPALIQGTLEWKGIAPILGGWMAFPPEEMVNALHFMGKRVEIASIYTMVAGLLNILAIFDAYGGPATVASARRDEESAREQQQASPAPAGASARAEVRA